MAAEGGADGPRLDRKAVRAVLKRHEGELLKRLNVVGLGVGEGAGDDAVLVVMVREKVPPEQLPPGALLPKQLEGVRVVVREIGDIRPQGD